MAEYGKPEIAIPGLLFGSNHEFDSAIANEDIQFGAPVFGFVGEEGIAYSPKINKASTALDGDLVTANVLTTTINTNEVATTFVTDHAATMTAHIAAINADNALIALGVVAKADGARGIIITAPASVTLSVTQAVTLGDSQAKATVTAGTTGKFLGVATYVATGSRFYGAGNACYEKGSSVSICKRGELWVKAESTVSDKEAAYAVTVGVGTIGGFTDVATNNYDIGGYFRSNVTDGLARLEVRGLK